MPDDALLSCRRRCPFDRVRGDSSFLRRSTTAAPGGGWVIGQQWAVREHGSGVHMKKLIVPVLIGLSAMTLFSGCIGFSIGGAPSSKPPSPTLGQQLIDLQKAKETGAITETEYQTQKTKMLGKK